MALALVPLSEPAAQPVGADGDDFLYRTLQGDTLLGLADRFTTTAANWTILQEINAVTDPTRLPIAKTIRIPFSLIPIVSASVQARHVSGGSEGGWRDATGGRPSR